MLFKLSVILSIISIYMVFNSYGAVVVVARPPHYRYPPHRHFRQAIKNATLAECNYYSAQSLLNCTSSLNNNTIIECDATAGMNSSTHLKRFLISYVRGNGINSGLTLYPQASVFSTGLQSLVDRNMTRLQVVQYGLANQSNDISVQDRVCYNKLIKLFDSIEGQDSLIVNSKQVGIFGSLVIH